MLIKTDDLFVDANRDWQMVALRPTDRCFLCGAQVVREAVVWCGADERAQQIWLHPRCAMSLSNRLKEDVTGEHQKWQVVDSQPMGVEDG